MQKKTTRLKTTRPQTKVNKEAFKMLATEIGLNAACRKLGVPIPTGKSWAQRGGWDLPKRKGGRPLRTIEASGLHPVADVLVQTHKELESNTKTALMQTAAKAATHAAQKPPLDVSNTSQLRDLAQSAARIFGWDSDKGASVTNNTLVVTTEQLQQMRELCDADEPYTKPAISEGGSTPAAATEELSHE